MRKQGGQHICYPINNACCLIVVWLVHPSAPFSGEESKGDCMHCSAQGISPEPRSWLTNSETLLVSLCAGFPALCNNCLTSLLIIVLKITFLLVNKLIFVLYFTIKKRSGKSNLPYLKGKEKYYQVFYNQHSFSKFSPDTQRQKDSLGVSVIPLFALFSNHHSDTRF